MRLPNKWLDKATAESFNLVAEDDFNPDGVLLMGYDLYEAGFNHGLIAAGVLAGVVLAGCIIGHIKGREERDK